MAKLGGELDGLGCLSVSRRPASGSEVQFGQVTERIGKSPGRARLAGLGNQTFQGGTHPIELFEIEEGVGVLDQLDRQPGRFSRVNRF